MERLAGESAFVEEVLEAMAEAVAITEGTRVLHVNGEFCRLFGYERTECLGQELDELVLPEGRLHESEMLLHGVGMGGRSCIETVRKTARGEMLDVSVLAARLRLAGGGTGLFVTYRDIRPQRLESARLQHTALHDGLTGLANRALFLERVRLTLGRLQRRPDRGFAVVFLDLDGFKKVNDTLGHAAGDVLLREVGQRLKRGVRPQDTVARFGGDEFALLLDETGTGEEALQVAQRLGEEVARGVRLGEVEAHVGASMGIAVATTVYAEAEEILRHADVAMYAAKQAGKGRCVVWGARSGTARGRRAVLGFGDDAQDECEEGGGEEGGSSGECSGRTGDFDGHERVGQGKRAEGF